MTEIAEVPPVDADGVLAALDPEQRAAATALSGPVCILAGAGTGKTRAITHRIAYGVLSGAWQAQHVLAVTFTTRAAGEMRGRLRALGVPGVQARTFHSAALRQARYFWPRVHQQELPPLVESKLRYVAEAAVRCRVDTDLAGRRDLAGEIEWCKVGNVRPDDYPQVAGRAGRQMAGFDAQTVARVFAGYEELRRERGFIDFEDVLLCAAALLADHPKIAATVHQQYRHFIVDEYQDVSPIQQALLELWCGERTDVCVVGDAAQTIYSFAGASPSYLLDFGRRHPSATVVRLVRDYRSTPQVVRVANAVLAGARFGRATGPGGPAEQPNAADYRLELRAQRPDGPQPTFREYPDEITEAEAVSGRIKRLIDAGTPAREIAILFRVNAQSEAYEQALGEHQVPFLVRGAERFFDRAEVKRAIVLLRGAAKQTIPTGPGEGPADLRQEVRAVLTSAGWTPEPPSGTGQVRERWESLSALASLADDVAKASAEPVDLAGFVAVLQARAEAQHAPTANGVTLSTLHAAKGLEWDAVFLIGMHEGTMPITYAETPDQVEEERRLFYVGVTRAREHLAVSWSLSRTPGGRGRRAPTRFLDGVRPAGTADADRDSGASGRRRRRGEDRTARTVAGCRVCGRPLHDAAERKVGRCADCPATYDEALLDQLREWRSRTAKEQSMPAYCVFTDATLIAIAETVPTRDAELGRIPGIGAAKIAKYGEAVLAIVGRRSTPRDS